MKYKNLIEFFIFFILISLPLISIFFLINSWDEGIKQKKFIQEKISKSYVEFKNEDPIVSEIVDKNKLSKLNFYEKIENKDLIFFYKSRRLAFFIDRESSEIIGFSIIK